jgi:hypothetical protein
MPPSIEYFSAGGGSEGREMIKDYLARLLISKNAVVSGYGLSALKVYPAFFV